MLKQWKRLCSILLCGTLLLGVGGCSGARKGNGDSHALVKTCHAMKGFRTSVKILFDFEESTLEYGGKFEYNKEDNDKFTLEVPASLQGMEIITSGETPKEMTVQYADTALDCGPSARPGATPADVLPVLANTICTEAPLEIWDETTGGVKMTAARYEHTDESGKIMQQVWFTRSSFQPAYAEVYADGERVLQVFFSEFQADESRE